MMTRELIYLAGPYSHPDEGVVEQRYDAHLEAAAQLIGTGAMVFSPIAHTHPIAMAHELPADFEFWREFDHRMIDACDKVVVLCVDGWRESVGVTAEIEYARGQGKEVRLWHVE